MIGRGMAALLAVVCAGCGDDAPVRPDAGGAVQAPDPQPPEKQGEAAPRERPAARVRSLLGTVRVGARTARAGEAIEAGSRIRLEPESHVVLELPEGSLVELRREAVAVIAELGSEEIILIRGEAYANVARESRPREPLRIATPALTATLRAGELFALAPATGVSWFAQAHGRAELSNGVSVDGALVTRTLEAGQQVAVGLQRQPVAEPRPIGGEDPGGDAPQVPASERIAQLRGMADAIEALGQTPDPSPLAEGDQPLEAWVDEAVVAVEEERRHGEETAQAQRAAVAGGDRPRVAELQRELAAHGVRLLALRKILLGRAEALAARIGYAELRTPHAGGDRFHSRRARILAALGR